MAKKVKAIVKLQCPAGKANPAPPVGPALGQHGVNIMEFVKQYNERTSQQVGQIIPVEITIFEDRTFTFVTLPTLFLFGSPEPFSIFAAFFRRIAAGGVFVMKVNERSL